jgi:N-methylhydantoinase A/oxoprolinase/acetone carboxylase beta subunit
VSTTLATNAVVENRFSPVCTLLIGFDDAMVERSGLQRHGSGGLVVRVQGGHGATGEESAPLDEAAVTRAVVDHEGRVEAFAIAANFSGEIPLTNCARGIDAR